MISGIGNFPFVSIVGPFRNDARAQPLRLPEPTVRADELKHAFRGIVSLRESLEELIEALGVRRVAGTALPAAVSSKVLGLNMNANPAQNVLTAPEINATPTSIAPFGPSFVGPSTALPSVDGAYTGNTDETFTFKAQDNGTIGGAQQLRFEVRNGANQKVDQIVIPANTPAETQFVLGNGLVVSFSGGDVVKNDSFQVQALASVGSVVNPDKPFNGVGNDRPNFEFGKSVAAGSFDVNGTTIQVFADDTINTVLGRINQSSAGVLAEFDPAGESIRLTQLESGTLSFTLENDTSGFLAATKLGGASDLIFTTLTSGEVNATPTSLDPFGPAFQGASTSSATVTGAYAGSTDDTLTFEVTKGGGIGGNDQMKLDVLDGTQTKIDQIVINPGTPADTVFTLDNGLQISFSAGDLVKGDSFTVNVYATVGSVVDPDKPFNGVRNDSPNFELGKSVTGGSFSINGVSIDVFENDTIHTVLDRINASGAGVQARFFAGSEIVQLRQTTPGPVDIAVGNDTSGFLDAVKLLGRTPELGTYIPSDPNNTLSGLSQFSGVTAGTFTVNGVSIGVDPDNDTLLDVLDRINFSGAGVDAVLDPSGSHVRFLASDATTPIVLADGDANFFTALGINPGTYAPTISKEGAKVRAHRAAELLTDAADAFNGLYRQAAQSSLVLGIRNDLQSIIGAAFEKDGSLFRTDFGISFDFRQQSNYVFSFFGSEQASFKSAFRRDPDAVREFFLEPRSRDEPGFAQKLIDRLQAAESDIKNKLGSVGLFVSVVA